MTSEQLSAEQVKAARALLTWSQSDLAKASRLSMSTVADFERKSRAPIAGSETAIRVALETEGISFVSGGVLPTSRVDVPKLSPGALVRWISASDLTQWGERRDAQARLPELIRSLIYASVGPDAQVRFPSGDSISQSGWDGICETHIQVPYVPKGISGWEFGAQRSGIRKKAEDDYTKRSGEPLELAPLTSTFVFITPHRWASKGKWVSAKRKEGRWNDVLALDADDLAHWLELYPAVANVFAHEIGHRPEGLQSLEDFWREWSLSTRPPLSAELVTTARDDSTKAVTRWLLGAPSALAIQAEASEEAIAFAFGVIAPFPPAYRQWLLGRAIVATEPEARTLIGLGYKFIVILRAPDAGLANRLAEDGHHVLSAYGSEIGLPANVMRLERPWRDDLRRCLEDLGLSEEHANQYASQSGRSLSVLRRLMPAPVGSRPSWSVDPDEVLLSAMLAGAWHGDVEADRRIIEAMCGLDYESFERRIVRYAQGLDAPLVRSGPIWKINSLRDVWLLTASHLNASLVDRYLIAFSEVMTRVGDNFTKNDQSDFFASLDSKRQCSAGLRRGLTESLIAMSVFGRYAPNVPNVDYRAEHAVRSLLSTADEPLWWSLSNDFRRLSEAAPQAFLDCLESALDKADQPLRALFRSDTAFLSPREYLSDILWALETLAWSPELLGQVTLILGSLDEMDSGGRFLNRPSNSLRQIFLPWSPQTHATAEDRLRVLDVLAKKRPETGWRTLLSLAPRGHDTSTPSPQPMWREFAPKENAGLAWAQVFRFTAAVNERLLIQVGGDAARWKELLGHWPEFAPEWQEQAAAKLANDIPKFRNTTQGGVFREELRRFIHHHRSFPDTDWSLSGPELAPLEKAFEALEPDDIVEKNTWLFDRGAAHEWAGDDWQASMLQLRERQRVAASEIVKVLDDAAILDFAGRIKSPYEFGFAVASSNLNQRAKEKVLEKSLSKDNSAAEDLSRGMLDFFSTTVREELISDYLQRDDENYSSPLARKRLLLALSPCKSVWNMIEANYPELKEGYWRAVNPYAILDPDDRVAACSEMVAVKRGLAAVQVLAQSSVDIRIDPTLIFSALRAAAEASNETQAQGMSAYWVGKLFERLDRDEAVPQNELMALEWTYFEVLRHSSRPARALNERLSQDPAFFVELLEALYSPDPESKTGVAEPEPTDPERAAKIATQAYRVLSGWTRLPGSDWNGVIDQKQLMAWVKSARKLAARTGRGRIADSKIGGVLATSPQADQTWPPEAVCDVIESVRSADLDDGFHVGAANKRGVTIRSPRDGGTIERSEAKRYRGWAREVAAVWPRARALLERLAADYERQARDQDQQAEQRDW